MLLLFILMYSMIFYHHVWIRPHLQDNEMQRECQLRKKESDVKEVIVGLGDGLNGMLYYEVMYWNIMRWIVLK